jgi:hypothetical protein
MGAPISIELNGSLPTQPLATGVVTAVRPAIGGGARSLSLK